MKLSLIVNNGQGPGHGKFVLTGKSFSFEDLGFCPKTNTLIFKRFFKRFIKTSE